MTVVKYNVTIPHACGTLVHLQDGITQAQSNYDSAAALYRKKPNDKNKAVLDAAKNALALSKKTYYRTRATQSSFAVRWSDQFMLVKDALHTLTLIAPTE